MREMREREREKDLDLLYARLRNEGEDLKECKVHFQVKISVLNGNWKTMRYNTFCKNTDKNTVREFYVNDNPLFPRKPGTNNGPDESIALSKQIHFKHIRM